MVEIPARSLRPRPQQTKLPAVSDRSTALRVLAGLRATVVGDAGVPVDSVVTRERLGRELIGAVEARADLFALFEREDAVSAPQTR